MINSFWMSSNTASLLNPLTPWRLMFSEPAISIKLDISIFIFVVEMSLYIKIKYKIFYIM